MLAITSADHVQRQVIQSAETHARLAHVELLPRLREAGPQTRHGKALVTLDAGDADFDATLETGGSKTVASSSQTFAGDASTSIVNHTHDVNVGSVNDTNTVTGSGNIFAGTTSSVTATTGNPKGGGVASYTQTGTNTPGAATSVVQPYIVLKCWQRSS